MRIHNSASFYSLQSVKVSRLSSDVTPNRHTGESRYPERLTALDSGFCRNDGKYSILPGSEGSA